MVNWPVLCKPSRNDRGPSHLKMGDKWQQISKGDCSYKMISPRYLHKLSTKTNSQPNSKPHGMTWRGRPSPLLGKPPTCDEDLNPSSNISKSADLKSVGRDSGEDSQQKKGIKGENNLESENGISFQMTREKMKHRPPQKKRLLTRKTKHPPPPKNYCCQLFEIPKK